ncbi:RNA polymerase sigma factor [Brevundimonas sp. PAMC22021]|uniref:RNA polymerase sigma factor n=1 Tax=Brevundimonas sp. PAMC22021 TaxID=2861285 RepID=UPI001C62EF75|nr:RNA polymerase sigma factor [Brevundimonas sp. PAMC22021]QYF87056.1 RNA polymerase sigma factor [Brevundimonas sp. PAMC22021]
MSDRTGGLRDREADSGLHDLYRAYSGWLTARLRRRFGEDADDLVQEAWIRAAPYSRHGLIEHPKALLMRIVDNLAIDRARRRGPRPLSLSDHVQPEPAVDLASQADAVLLKQIILNMPPRLRDVFVLSRFAHLEYQEIGERLNIPVTTVQWRMQKALEYCAAQLRL